MLGEPSEAKAELRFPRRLTTLSSAHPPPLRSARQSIVCAAAQHRTMIKVDSPEVFPLLGG